MHVLIVSYVCLMESSASSRQVSALEDELKGRRRGSVVKALSTALPDIRSKVLKVNWPQIFRASFMLLFVAYPGTPWRCGIH